MAAVKWQQPLHAVTLCFLFTVSLCCKCHNDFPSEVTLGGRAGSQSRTENNLQLNSEVFLGRFGSVSDFSFKRLHEEKTSKARLSSVSHTQTFNSFQTKLKLNVMKDYGDTHTPDRRMNYWSEARGRLSMNNTVIESHSVSPVSLTRHS